jgi:hypothetical protein
MVQVTNFDSLHHFTLRSSKSKNLTDWGPEIKVAKVANRLFQSTAAKIAHSIVHGQLLCNEAIAIRLKNGALIFNFTITRNFPACSRICLMAQSILERRNARVIFLCTYQSTLHVTLVLTHESIWQTEVICYCLSSYS